MNHKTALSAIKKWLSPFYSQTRCPVCLYLVFVDGNGNMEVHGSGIDSCYGSEKNDEEVADELDRANSADRERQERQAADLLAER